MACYLVPHLSCVPQWCGPFLITLSAALVCSDGSSDRGMFSQKFLGRMLITQPLVPNFTGTLAVWLHLPIRYQVTHAQPGSYDNLTAVCDSEVRYGETPWALSKGVSDMEGALRL